MRFYVSASFQKNDQKRVEEICSIIRELGHTDYCFIRDESNFETPQDMMQKAKKEIEKSDIILLEYDGAAHGRMIELGIAYALDKTIVVIAKQGLPVKDTIGGVADHVIEFNTMGNLKTKLQQLTF